MTIQKISTWLCWVAVGLACAACGDAFDVHPYDTRFDGETDINAHNIGRIAAACEGKDTLRIAFISDTHGWYSDTRDEIRALNRRADLDFVVHCGDLTDTGTTKEFTWVRSLLGDLRVPYVALIGNHDFLGTGDQVYGRMFGAKDFSFVAADVKFVCLNTNATEYDYLAAVPNFDFIEAELTPDTTRYRRTVVVMHAPPLSDQFNNNVFRAFGRYLSYFPGLLFCVYAHNHDHLTQTFYDELPPFYGVDCAEHRNYRLITIHPDGYEEAIVDY